MKKIDKHIGLYFIIDGDFTRDFLAMTKLAINLEVKIIQYRDKNASPTEMLKNATEIRELTEKSDTIFIVNDNIEVALKSHAGGVHIGQEDIKYEDARKMLPEKIIGVSTDNLEQSLFAEKMGADYIGLGPIFPTSTKPDAGPIIGIKKLSEIVKTIQIPIVAIGGINVENLVSVLATKVSGVAIISAILGKLSPENEIKKIINKIKKYNQMRG
ncbi:MAG: thiamine phosphate synthase [Candidatus Cloacimonetes bacterium]|nr:thiamine phosphate synthase [Candidatus Cloacimonadota bacterium]MBL7086667.1 thiamine phosphate synthase [Candidatus Cloacimonadota bacterium]